MYFRLDSESLAIQLGKWTLVASATRHNLIPEEPYGWFKLGYWDDNLGDYIWLINLH